MKGQATLNGPPRKKKRGEDAEDTRILNNHQFEAFKMKPKEDWRMFCGEIMKSRPAWDNSTLMCHRWWIKGYCFPDCAHSGSHVEKETVSAEKEKEFGTWMKKARGTK